MAYLCVSVLDNLNTVRVWGNQMNQGIGTTNDWEENERKVSGRWQRQSWSSFVSSQKGLSWSKQWALTEKRFHTMLLYCLSLPDIVQDSSFDTMISSSGSRKEPITLCSHWSWYGQLCSHRKRVNPFVRICCNGVCLIVVSIGLCCLLLLRCLQQWQ